MDGHEFSKMDKNKSTHKLKGLPHIYWLNLDADEDRRFYMEEQFKYTGVLRSILALLDLMVGKMMYLET